jgi:hypothetical protein
MRQTLQLSILFSVLCASAAFGQTQNIPPPPPVVFLPQQSASTTCDSTAMFCLNTCVSASPTTPSNPQCNLNCTSAQLVCKQRC